MEHSLVPCPVCGSENTQTRSSFFNDTVGCECDNMFCEDCNEQWIAYFDDIGEGFDCVVTSADVLF